ncbi:MAG TPA: 30S processome protein Utp24 [Pyrodictium delaneyi]|uniref:30S processome protein Utp24 n=1 Tax=Pyrodictium delaneyi TaxID=1273541 RepID=A0A832ZTQ9_9CREN|nr:30S processome protein Utp24 [Pyrodictium delaneyi]
MGVSKRLKRVIYDTSILMLLYEGVPVFEESASLLLSKPECVIPRQVRDELKKLAGTASSIHRRKAAHLALEAIRKMGCRIVDVDADNTDDAIIAIVMSDPEAIVATADNELRRRLREIGLPNIYYRRSRHGLMLEGA